MSQKEFVVTRRYDPDGGPPTTELVPSNRYNSNQNFVAPIAQPARRQPVQVTQVAEIIGESGAIVVDGPLQALEGSRETTTSIDRSKALVVRLIPFSAVWLILSVGVTWWASMGGWFMLCFFAGLTACTYAVMDRQEYQFSRNGLERHKVNTLADLKRDEMAHQHELRRMALEAHLKMLGVNDENA